MFQLCNLACRRQALLAGMASYMQDSMAGPKTGQRSRNVAQLTLLCKLLEPVKYWLCNEITLMLPSIMLEAIIIAAALPVCAVDSSACAACIVLSRAQPISVAGRSSRHTILCSSLKPACPQTVKSVIGDIVFLNGTR